MHAIIAAEKLTDVPVSDEVEFYLGKERWSAQGSEELTHNLSAIVFL